MQGPKQPPAVGALARKDLASRPQNGNERSKRTGISFGGELFGGLPCLLWFRCSFLLFILWFLGVFFDDSTLKPLPVTLAEGASLQVVSLRLAQPFLLLTSQAASA